MFGTSSNWARLFRRSRREGQPTGRRPSSVRRPNSMPVCRCMILARSSTPNHVLHCTVLYCWRETPPPLESGDGRRLREAGATHRSWRHRLAGDRMYPHQARLQVATPTARRRMLTLPPHGSVLIPVEDWSCWATRARWPRRRRRRGAAG